MDNDEVNSGKQELQKGKPYQLADSIAYVPHSVVCKTILKKPSGTVLILAFDGTEVPCNKACPFDVFVQIIEGKAEIVIDGTPYLIEAGQGIVLPAHLPNFIRPNGRFKIIRTIIKSGYE
jgi:mannose-6-phosphate isomerase-like protein (cupin superfamily)